MIARIRNRDVRYEVDAGFLCQVVSGDRSYVHRCPRAAFELVAHALDDVDAAGAGATLATIAGAEQLPFTQVHVALEFLKDRGLVQVRRRRSYPADVGGTYLGAMVEFLALQESPHA